MSVTLEPAGWLRTLAFVLVGAGVATAIGSAVAGNWWGVPAGALVVGLAAIMLGTRLRIDDDAVTVRQFGSRTYPWSEIDAVDVRTGRRLALRMTDGTEVRLPQGFDAELVVAAAPPGTEFVR